MIDKVLLFGSTGMLGSYVYSYFSNIPCLSIASVNYRITSSNLAKLEDILIEHNIDCNTCVINCVGLIPQRKQGHSEHEYYLVNAIFPQILSIICQKYDAKMIQPTTDCVFSGNREEGLYKETDIHDETGHYGMSKSLGEPANCTVIRTSIIGREKCNKRSFLEWVLSNKDKEITGWSNHYWNGITCLEYCKVMHRIIKENLFWMGVRHIYSPTPVSKYELACMIRSVFGLESIQIRKIECEHIVNKTLCTNFEKMFEISELYDQLNGLKE